MSVSHLRASACRDSATTPRTVDKQNVTQCLVRPWTDKDIFDRNQFLAFKFSFYIFDAFKLNMGLEEKSCYICVIFLSV